MALGRFLVFLGIVAVFFLFAYFIYSLEDDYRREEVNVTRIVDGDTIETGIWRVRLLGINSPERGMFGYEEAKQRLEVLEGKIVELEGDKKNNEDIDMYGRKLRYVFFKRRMINSELLRGGYVTLYYYENLKYNKELINAEEFARKNELRLWKKSKDECKKCIILAELDKGGEDDCDEKTEKVVLINKCDFDCDLNGWSLKDAGNHIYKFKHFVLKKKQDVIIYNGVGREDSDELFFQNTGCASIWNDDGDRLYLRDNQGLLVLYYVY